ncbi:MAG: ABC transporter permease [Ignavibacteriaceae bacterium]
MIKIRFSALHFFFLLMLATIAFRLPLLGSIALLLISYLRLLVTDYHTASAQFSLSMADYFCSLFLMLSFFVFLFLERKKLTSLKVFSFSHYVMAVILYAFLFAPVIANSNSDFQKDISVTRLLPPFSSVKVLHLIDPVEKPGRLNNFLALKKKIVKNSFDEKIVFLDSLQKRESGFFYYQNGVEHRLQNSSIETLGGKPDISHKFFLLGSDEFGRDIFTRLIYGTRISLLIGLSAVSLALIVGILLGFLAGFSGGLIDVFLSRLTDMFLSFPIIFFIILILAFFGNSFLSVVVVLGFSGWMSLFRIVKGEVLSLKNKDYFITAQQLGLSKTKLLLKEVLPVIIIPVIINMVFQFGNVVLSESALSFLGLGIGNEFPTWGGMLNSGQEYLSQAWWMIFFPGAAIVLLLVTINDFGRKLAEYFNPRLHL